MDLFLMLLVIIVIVGLFYNPFSREEKLKKGLLEAEKIVDFYGEIIETQSKNYNNFPNSLLKGISKDRIKSSIKLMYIYDDNPVFRNAAESCYMLLGKFVDDEYTTDEYFENFLSSNRNEEWRKLPAQRQAELLLAKKKLPVDISNGVINDMKALLEEFREFRKTIGKREDTSKALTSMKRGTI